MKDHLFLVTGLLIVLNGSVSAQDSASSCNFPFTLEASYTGDAFGNFSGGIKKGATYLGLAHLGITFDTEKAGFWKGGQFYVLGANTHGGTPTETYIGDVQVASNIEAGSLTFVQELWIKQCFGKLTTILGVQDLNAQFAASDNASLFLNSSFGVHSTISNNIPSPIFPLTALGWQFQYDFSTKTSVKVALFDGLPEGFKHNTHNLSWKLDPNEGYLLVSEYSVSDLVSERYPGTYKIGTYYHNHYDSGNAADSIGRLNHENYGFYMVADQTLFKTPEGRALSLFVQASLSPKSKNTNCNYWGMGLNFVGLFQNRADDVLGLAVARAGFKNSIYDSETALELTYKSQFGTHFYLQPDLQYVIHPAGTDEKLSNALVGILRFEIDF